MIHVAVAHAVQRKDPYHSHLTTPEIHCGASVESCFVQADFPRPEVSALPATAATCN
jgi:hypothetical protein